MIQDHETARWKTGGDAYHPGCMVLYVPEELAHYVAGWMAGKLTEGDRYDRLVTGFISTLKNAEATDATT